MSIRTFFYGLLVLGILALDRLSKAYALMHWREEYLVNPYLLFQVTHNRGISWGMFNSAHTAVFFVVTLAIVSVTAVLIGYTYHRSMQGKSIVGELCVIAGSCSNSIDRLLFGGVVDFIMVHKGHWYWPIFNVADSFIVLGVGIMFLELMTDHDLSR